MQIDEGLLVKFFAWIFGAITAMLTTLYWYIWKGDRRRLKVLEENSVDRVELHAIVADVKREFKGDHDGLHSQIESVREEIKTNRYEIREDIRDLREALTTKYAGSDRRRQ